MADGSRVMSRVGESASTVDGAASIRVVSMVGGSTSIIDEKVGGDSARWARRAFFQSMTSQAATSQTVTSDVGLLDAREAEQWRAEADGVRRRLSTLSAIDAKLADEETHVTLHGQRISRANLDLAAAAAAASDQQQKARSRNGRVQRSAATAARQALKKTAAAEAKHTSKEKERATRKRRATHGADDDDDDDDDDRNRQKRKKGRKSADQDDDDPAFEPDASPSSSSSSDDDDEDGGAAPSKGKKHTTTKKQAKQGSDGVLRPVPIAPAAVAIASLAARMGRDELGRTSVYDRVDRTGGSEAIGADSNEPLEKMFKENSQVVRELRMNVLWRKPHNLPSAQVSQLDSLNFHLHIRKPGFEAIHPTTKQLEPRVVHTLDEAYVAMMRASHITTFHRLFTVPDLRAYFFGVFVHMASYAREALTPRSVSFALYAIAYCLDSPDSADNEDYGKINALMDAYADFGSLAKDAGESLDKIHPITAEVAYIPVTFPRSSTLFCACVRVSIWM